MNPPVASPCINVCRMDEQTGLCAGCLRTLDEIASWGQASNARRLEILQHVEQRRLASTLAEGSVA